MSIPQSVVDELMVQCGRRCCICRRFEPLHLQIHHIVEQSDGGTDAIDNLIPVCLTCHSDVHTHTKLTRRFTVDELKGHRSALIAMVNDGKLPGSVNVPTDDCDVIVSNLIGVLRHSEAAHETTPDVDLPSHAIELLLGAVTKGKGMICDKSYMNTRGTDINAMREDAKRKDALDHLQANDLVAYARGVVYTVTHEGFLLADKIIALAEAKDR